MALATDSAAFRYGSEAGFSASHHYPARDKPVLALVRELTSRKDIASIRETSPSPSAKRLGLHAKHSRRASHWTPGGCAVGA